MACTSYCSAFEQATGMGGGGGGGGIVTMNRQLV